MKSVLLATIAMTFEKFLTDSLTE